MKRVHCILKGRVQGVFFRDFVEKRAFLYKIKGFVKNLADGDLEIVAEGEEELLKQFLNECKEGPHMSNVEDIEVTEEEPKGEFEKFDVKY